MRITASSITSAACVLLFLRAACDKEIKITRWSKGKTFEVGYSRRL
jgi:hypothetical protein